MDRISVALLTGIILLIMVSAYLVTTTWIIGNEGDNIETVENNAAADDRELVFNNDTSVTNSSNRKLWVRARIIYPGDASPERYKVVSEAVEKGQWILSDDGWYYCRAPLGYLKTSEPLIDRLLYDGKEPPPADAGRFRMQAEAVDEAWLISKPKSAKEAFRLFKKLPDLDDITYL